MNVIQKFFDDLPAHWQEYIRKQDWFDLKQFSSNVSIQFEDGSNCFFRYAFLVQDSDRGEIAVFTEHCGYFVFQMRGLEHWATLKDVTNRN